jgi:hypothetical protein
MYLNEFNGGFDGGFGKESTRKEIAKFTYESGVLS